MKAIHRRKAGALALCFWLALCTLMPGLAAAGAPFAIKTVNNPNPKDRLHLRTEPRANAPSLGKYYNGVRILVHSETSNGWSFVTIGDTAVSGYMNSRYLANEGVAVASAIPTATVNVKSGSKLNLREGMTERSTALSSYARGTKVQVMGYGRHWHHVRVDGKTGYMSARYLTIGGISPGGGTGGGATQPPGQTAKLLFVNNANAADRLHLRATPSAGATSYGKYYNGVAVEVLAERNDGWVKVRIENDLTGYMQRKYLSDTMLSYALPELTVIDQGPNEQLNLRAAPSVNATSRGKFSNGTKVTVLGVRDDGWYHVILDGPNGTGFMMAKYLSPQLTY